MVAFMENHKFIYFFFQHLMTTYSLEAMFNFIGFAVNFNKSVRNREIFMVKINVVRIHQERQHLTRIYKTINKNAEKRGPNIEPCGIFILISMTQNS